MTFISQCTILKALLSHLSTDSALLSSEKDSKIVLYHFLLTIIASILENGVSILNFREIFRSGKIGVEETFYVVEKWKIQKSREIFRSGIIGEEETYLCSVNRENLKMPSLEPLQQ